MKNRLMIPRLIVIIVSLVSVIGLFLPYIASTEEYREYLQAKGAEKIYDNVDLTAQDTKELSLFEYSKVYYQGRQEIFRNDAEGIFYAVIFAAPGLLGLLTFICALRKRAIPMGILSLVMGGAIRLINWDVVDRGIMPSVNRVWGISHSLYYPCAVILFLCSIWFLVTKHKMKKEGHP